MKIKLWFCVFTLVISAVLLMDYEKEYRREHSKAQNDLETLAIEEESTAYRDLILRVLIRSDDYKSIYHTKLEISGTGSFGCRHDAEEELFHENDIFCLEEDPGEGEWLLWSCNCEDHLVIENLSRKETPAQYPGSLRIYLTEQGYVVVNEVPLEKYLPFVLSSEMSSSFPEEALKAQAVCARTYAVRKVVEAADAGYGAHLDDSVSFQVYNNLKPDKAIRKAVSDTGGQILATEDGLPAEIYYYSTSCGVTEADHLSSDALMEQFLETTREEDPERHECWYRWQAELSYEEIRENLSEYTSEVPEQITDIKITARSENGQANVLEIDGIMRFDDAGDRSEYRGLGEPAETIRIEGEYPIRRVLKTSPGHLTLQDGTLCDSLSLLPSAWFVLQPSKEDGVIRLLGGGYGHGNGMSQCGAKQMAVNGKKYREILETYYPETTLAEGSFTR